MAMAYSSGDGPVDGGKTVSVRPWNRARDEKDGLAVTERTGGETANGIRAVLFDAVGTLFHSDPPITRVYAEAGRRWGAGLDEAEVAARFAPAFFRHFGRPGRASPAELTVSSESVIPSRDAASFGPSRRNWD